MSLRGAQPSCGQSNPPLLEVYTSKTGSIVRPLLKIISRGLWERGSGELVLENKPSGAFPLISITGKKGWSNLGCRSGGLPAKRYPDGPQNRAAHKSGRRMQVLPTRLCLHAAGDPPPRIRQSRSKRARVGAGGRSAHHYLTGRRTPPSHRSDLIRASPAKTQPLIGQKTGLWPEYVVFLPT